MFEINRCEKNPVALGSRIVGLHKEQNITQIQAAEALGVSQQTINSYEVGRRRLPTSALPTLARLLSVSIDGLLGETNLATKKRGSMSKLHQQIERVSSLRRSKQKFVSEMIDTVLQQVS